MTVHTRSQQQILEKLDITALNSMQLAAQEAIARHRDVVILSPTGTGKTLAFLLPMLELLDKNSNDVQALILVPSRELAIQIEQVARSMGSGYKVNAVYGGRAFVKDKEDLQHLPTLLVGTPGRIADHLRRGSFATEGIKTLVLDEFDKSLEVGFEGEMREIINGLPNVSKRVLTSATQQVQIPGFVGVLKPKTLNFLGEQKALLTIKRVVAPTKDKLGALEQLLCHVGDTSGIIFCNFKDTIQWVSDFLTKQGIAHGCFYGGMEQRDRERALIKFRNKTHNLLIATDLAARGIDVPELDFIIHYQLPIHSAEFTHRNGRTARMNAAGTAYVVQWEKESLPEFIQETKAIQLRPNKRPKASIWQTLFISGGRKDKISKGDLAGVFFKQGKLEREELGVIELKKDCAFVAVPKQKAAALVQLLNNTRIKKKKVRVTLI